jgi:hypothetical protein
MTHLLAWLADVALGPLCPYGCGFRARGHRTLAAHNWLEHAGDHLEGIR